METAHHLHHDCHHHHHHHHHHQVLLRCCCAITSLLVASARTRTTTTAMRSSKHTEPCYSSCSPFTGLTQCDGLTLPAIGVCKVPLGRACLICVLKDLTCSRSFCTGPHYLGQSRPPVNSTTPKEKPASVIRFRQENPDLLSPVEVTDSRREPPAETKERSLERE